jgi:hypothetical protein
MKMPSLKLDSYLEYAILGLLFGIPYGLLKVKDALVTTLVTLASGLIAASFHLRMETGYLLTGIVMISMVLAFKYDLLKEGFNSSPTQILKNIGSRGVVDGFKNKEEDEDDSKEYGSRAEIEGYEDIKKEKNETQAPAPEKDELPTPFKLGEIPSQVKNGPHIDAGSTLMKAIKSLNPDQINAMTKDTQQLIETQKSLMGMLGTMKPMLNDGKQLMDTFQQMFGQ